MSTKNTVFFFLVISAILSANDEQEEITNQDSSDYYEVLGVSPDASDTEIRKQYLTLARRFHTDKNSDATALQRVQSITQAYTVLGDPEKREEYDREQYSSSLNPFIFLSALIVTVRNIPLFAFCRG